MASYLAMSTVVAVLPILPFYIFSIEVALIWPMTIGVGMAFSMGYLAGKLGEEKNPLLIGALYAIIVIVDIETRVLPIPPFFFLPLGVVMPSSVAIGTVLILLMMYSSSKLRG